MSTGVRLVVKAIQKLTMMLLPFLGLVSLIWTALYPDLWTFVPPSTTTLSLNTTSQSHEQPVLSVLVLPHSERATRSNAIVQHLYEDGLEQSLVLTRATTNRYVNLVWIVDPQAAAAVHPNWCFKLLTRIQQVQAERRAVEGLSTSWPIHFVDNKDGSRIQRCELVEKAMPPGNVFYHQRGVVTERQFLRNNSTTTPWVHLGKRLKPPTEIQFHHKPIGVRTDVVQRIDDVLKSSAETRNVSIQSDIARVVRRDVDVVYFWELHVTNGRNAIHDVELRNLVYKVLKQMQQTTHYQIWLGLTGKRGEKGRRGVSTSYIQRLLQSKICVVAQRDQWEDHYRFMEALVAGPLVLTDTMLSLPPGLQDGVSIVEYHSANDLVHKIYYYLQHEKERLQVASMGRQVAMSRYRSWHQLEEIVLGRPVTTCLGMEECMTVNVSASFAYPSETTRQTIGSDESKMTTEKVEMKELQNEEMEQKQPGHQHLLICGGRGTTATRTVFEATCALGIPSVHWKKHCVISNSVENGFHSCGGTTNRTKVAASSSSVQAGLEAHMNLTRIYVSMASCLDGSSSPCPDVQVWRRQVMELVDVVMGSSEIMALHDTPYPSLMSYLVKSAKQQLHVEPTIILSERDPHDCTRSRSKPKKKLCGMDPVCKEQYTSTSAGGPFDVFSCMDRAKQQMGYKDYSQLQFPDMFTSIRALWDSGNSERIVSAMKAYQDWLGPQSNFTVNVFEHRVTLDSLTANLSRAISVEHFNLGKRTRLRISMENNHRFGSLRVKGLQ